MPEKPGYLNRFQFIKWWFFNKCHHPWTLYFELAFPATVEASHTLLMFDLGDAARSLFRPKGARTKRHGRKTLAKRGKKGGGGIPEPSDLLLGPVKETFEVDKRGVHSGAKFLWSIDTLGQKWLGRLMMVEVAEQWLYRYALMMNVEDGMGCGQPACRAEGVGPVSYGQFGVIAGTHEVWGTGGAFHASGITNMPAKRFLAAVSCTVTNIGDVFGGGMDRKVGIGLKAPFGADDQQGIWEFVTVSKGKSAQVMVSGFFYTDKGDDSSFRVTCYAPLENDEDPAGQTGWAISEVVIFAQAF